MFRNMCRNGAFDRIENEDSFVNLYAKDQARHLKIAVEQIDEAYNIATRGMRDWGGSTPFDLKYREDIINVHIKYITNCKEQPQRMALVK